MDGCSQPSHGANRNDQAHRPDGHSSRGRRKPGPNHFRANPRPENWSFDFLRCSVADSRTHTFQAARRPSANHMIRVLIATTNPGKLRDFAGAASPLGIEIASLPNFASIPIAVEDGLTFEANARKKAEYYSSYAPGEIVLADDSGLEVDALGGAPGVHSARYAADQPHLVGNNTDDQANNARLIRELRKIPAEQRTGRFVCVIAAARDGHTLAVFHAQ